MKLATLFPVIFTSVLCISCSDEADKTSRFTNPKGPTRKSTQNAPLQGPSGQDVLNDIRQDRIRQEREYRRYVSPRRY